MVKCDLLHMHIILPWHFLYLVKVCLYLRQGLFMSFGWDLFFISNFIFILITRLNVISIAPLHSVQPSLRLGEGSWNFGILGFWGGQIFFDFRRGLPYEGEVSSFSVHFLILKSKLWKIHQFLPAALSFSIFTFSDLKQMQSFK